MDVNTRAHWNPADDAGMGLRQNLRVLMDRVEHDMSEGELARRSNVPQPTIHRILKGETGNPKMETLRKLASALNCSIADLTSAALPQPIGAETSNLLAEIAANRPLQPESGSATMKKRRLVPVVGMARLGDNGNFVELEYPAGFGNGGIEWYSRDSQTYAVLCEGDSMLPRFNHGEFVIVEPSRQVVPGDEVIVRSVDGRVMIKIWMYTRDGRVHLHSVNPTHAPITIPEAEVATMQYVSGLAKKSMWFPE